MKSPEELREQAWRLLDIPLKSPEWAEARALQALAHIALADSIEREARRA